MSKSKPIWPKMPAPFVRAVLAGHSALGLAFAALIFLVCFSGTAVVLVDELIRWETPSVTPNATPMTADTLDRIRTQAMEKAEGDLHHIFVGAPTKSMPRTVVTIDTRGGPPYDVWTTDQAGELTIRTETPIFTFMQKLHFYLHLPPTWGLFVVGLTGVALLSSLISGVLAHPRVFRDAFHLRWGGSKRLQEADMHNRIGVWGLPFHIIISLTGAAIGLTTLLMGVLAFVAFKGDLDKAYALFLPPVPVDDPRPAPLAPLAPMFVEVERLAPGARITYATFEHPGETGQAVNLTAKRENELNAGQGYSFGGDGKLLPGGVQDSGTLGNAILQSLNVLHFGWFGGWPIKVAYVVLGAGLTLVTTSGVAIWLARRRDKGRPAPRWERVWSATCWSQPVAYPAMAIVLLLAPTIPGLAAWAVASLLAMATAIIWKPTQISWRLRLATAVLLVALPILHIAIHGATINDSMAWIINGVLVGLALLTGASLLRTSSAPKTAATAEAASS